jgi:hypothetical protein
MILRKNSAKLKYVQNSKIKVDAKYVTFGKGIKDF